MCVAEFLNSFRRKAVILPSLWIRSIKIIIQIKTMDKIKNVAWICIAGFVIVAGIIVFVNRDNLFGGKKEAAPADQPENK